MSDRLALIIANSEFDDPKLTRLATPSRDAEALARVLRDPDIGNFEVTLLINKTEPVVRRQIARLYHRRKRKDLLLLYYSGHGIRDELSGELYLATKDTEMDIASATALGAAFVRGQIDKGNSQRNVVILDCCHSGAFEGTKTVLGNSAGTQEAFAGSGYGRVILTASNAVEYAWEGDKLLGEAATSVFTRFLVRGIRTGAADRDGDGEISIDELYDYVYEQIVTGSFKQTPEKWAQKVQGDILIARNPHPVIKPAELPPALKESLQDHRVWVREGAINELKRLLHGDDERLALAAQQELERLLQDDSRRVSAAAARALGVSPSPSPVTALPVPRRGETGGGSIVSDLLAWLQGLPAWGRIAGAGLALAALIAIVLLLTQGGGGDGRPNLPPTDTPATKVAAPVAPTDTPGLAPQPTREPTATPTVQPTATNTPEPTPTVRPTATETPTSMPEPTATSALGIGSTMTRPRDDATMVYVPGGTFQMGSNEGDSDEQPVHEVTLDSFWIDKYQVTNARFAAFLNQQGNQQEGGVTWLDLTGEDCLIKQMGDEYQPKSGYADHPVVEVTWYGARAYCEWAEGRLPTEAEWEYAARGPDGNAYPWGNEFDCSRGNFDDETDLDDYVVPGGEGCDGYKRTSPVGSFENGASWCKALDMAGNVWEWTSSLYQDYPYRADDGRENPDASGSRVLRGGSWGNPSVYVRSASRNWSGPDGTYDDWGFRCAGASTSPSP